MSSLSRLRASRCHRASCGRARTPRRVPCRQKASLVRVGIHRRSLILIISSRSQRNHPPRQGGCHCVPSSQTQGPIQGLSPLCRRQLPASLVRHTLLIVSQSRTVVHNVLVGSVSLAVPGPKAFQNASTAQEVVVVTPTATDFEFRVGSQSDLPPFMSSPSKIQRWGDPSPMPPSPLPLIPGLTDILEDPTADGDQPTPVPPPILSFKPLPSQSSRSALILDRFSMHCPVQYCSNEHLLSTTAVMGRSFFDFVAPRSDKVVRSWVDVIKAWGVNERGQPSDGGFGYGKFLLLPKGRDSR